MVHQDTAHGARQATFWRKKELALLLGLALTVHAAVLRFIYPGYYKPLWPNHGDFYIPLGLANAPIEFLHFFKVARPAGEAFFWIIGNFGLHGSILAVIFLIMLNCVLSAGIFRHLFPVALTARYLVAFTAYAYLIFSHPYFYEFAAHDAFSQLSFFFLALSVLLFLRFCENPRSYLIPLCFCCALLGFLAKETYGLTALLLAITWFVTHKKAHLRAAITPVVIAATAFSIAILINIANDSMFISSDSASSSTYHLVLTPGSIFTEWWRYAISGLNILSAITLVALAASAWLFLSPRVFKAVLIILAAAGAAWVPNALLPKHFYPGYSWNGSYLLFLPILSLPLLPRAAPPSGIACGAAILIAAYVSPVLSADKYLSNNWSLSQEGINRNFITALDHINDQLMPDADYRVLVSGLNFPFHPFNHAYAIRMFPHMRKIHFSLLTYDGSRFTRGNVKFLPPEPHLLATYREVWAFRPDGTLAVRALNPILFSTAANEQLHAARVNLLYYPALMDIFNVKDTGLITDVDTYTYLKCGTALISYGNYAGAESCLKESIKSPTRNPYSFFYLGVAQEHQGKNCIARDSFRQAVTVDGPRPSNPAFRQALEHNQCKAADEAEGSERL